MLVSKEELMALTDEEKIGIIQVLEQSLIAKHSKAGDKYPFDEKEEKLLDERLEDYLNNPLDTISWDLFYQQETDRINNGKK